jgi:hypothetical protein
VVGFEIVRTGREPPNSLFGRWLAYYRVELDDPEHSGLRTVLELAEGRWRVETSGLTRQGAVVVHGVIVRGPGDAWSLRSETDLDGRPYARETAWFEPRAIEGGAELRVRYEIAPRNRRVGLALDMGAASLRREREATLDRFLASLSS